MTASAARASCLRLLVVLELEQELGDEDPAGHQVGVHLERLPHRVHRLVGALEVEHARQREHRAGVPGVEGERSYRLAARLGAVVLLEKELRQRHPGLHRARIRGDRFVERLECVLEELRILSAEVAAGGRHRLELGRGPRRAVVVGVDQRVEASVGAGAIAGLERELAEQRLGRQAIGAARFDLGFEDAPRVVVAAELGQRPAERQANAARLRLRLEELREAVGGILVATDRRQRRGPTESSLDRVGLVFDLGRERGGRLVVAAGGEMLLGLGGRVLRPGLDAAGEAAQRADDQRSQRPPRSRRRDHGYPGFSSGGARRSISSLVRARSSSRVSSSRR